MSQNTLYTLLLISFLIIVLYIFYLWDRIKDEKIKASQLLRDIEEEKKIRVQYDNFKNEQRLIFENQRLEFEKQKSDIIAAFEKQKNLENEQYRLGELEKEKVKIIRHTKETYDLLFNKWKKDFEMTIRKDAKFRSYSTLKGQSAENLLPFYKNFPFNSQDVRFMGNPIDLVIFDGLSEPGRQVDVYIVEIKTGGARLNTNQLRVKDAVDNGRVAWKRLNADDLQIESIKTP